MQLYKTLELRPSQLEKIYVTLGGRYSFWERLRGKRIGSPMMFYHKGTEQLDDLQSLAADELRINVELLKDGLLLRIAERTTSYFIPLAKEEIVAIDLSKDHQQTYLKLKVKPSFTIHLWGGIDHYYGWRDLIQDSFLTAISTLGMVQK